MVLKVLEKSSDYSSDYVYETDEFTVHYCNVFFASDSSLSYRVITATKYTQCKKTKKVTFWCGCFTLPNHLVNTLKINDFADWSPLPVPVGMVLPRYPQLEKWLEQKLLGENGWFCESQYDSSELFK